jgi:threonyl-tRNA synthetase
MNCPGSILVYKNEAHSYRDLPLKYAEVGTVHRHERSGTLHGLMRVRCFTQDDAHLYITHEQIEDTIEDVVKIIDTIYTQFGFKYKIELSTRPEDSMGSDEDWENATNGLKEAIESMQIPFVVNEGDGAFYGPKLDFHLEDSIGRTWQCGTIQLDFQLPQRFGLEYVGSDGQKHAPIIIHRVVFGSVERFMGILIEHYAGKFPTWLAPVQVKVLSVSEKSRDYAKQVADRLSEAGIRVVNDARDEKIGYKIREAQLDRVPYMLVIGEKEAESGTEVAVRSRDKGDMGTMLLVEFISFLKQHIYLRRDDY